MPRTRKTALKSVESYTHEDQRRVNNPPIGLVSSATDTTSGRVEYQHDPHIDPSLSWAGKVEGMSFEVPNVSLHVHERVDPQRIIKNFMKKDAAPKQQSLFDLEENELPFNKAIEFYSHEQDWSNRLIAGDSLLVMNSLLQKEGMGGKMQMVYIDPPYGIKYNSNFQPFTNKRDVKDNNDDDLPGEPEIIKAFRDTWELGIHSYLTYLRDRLLLARELLTDSGSVFVQINDENIHFIRSLMDEVFGSKNFVGQIPFATTSGFASRHIDSVVDYVVWYAKKSDALKYHQLYKEKIPGMEGASGYDFVELKDGTMRQINEFENSDLPEGARLFAKGDLLSRGAAGADQTFEFDGKKYKPNANAHWKAKFPEGMQRLADIGRIVVTGNTLRYKRYFDDFPLFPITNLWAEQLSEQNKEYVVQTATEVIKRCLLMTTDPGDLVFDPTCGSGTAAYVAEQWGRRWITCDTSRVAITVAKQRLMTSKFEYYEFAHPTEGISSGFQYKKVPHIMLGSLANNEPASEEVRYDQPLIDKSRVRVTGPFTVEAVPSLRTKPLTGHLPRVGGNSDSLARSGETGNQSLWRDELKATGIRGTAGKTISFSRLEPMAGTKFLHAEAEILEEKGRNKRAVICFGPDYSSLEQRHVEEAIKEARALKDKPDFIVFAAFHFDPEAAKDIDQIEWKGVTLLKAQMSVDLLTSDLRKKRSSNQSYWLIGQPDIEVTKEKDLIRVKVNGFDYYNPMSGEIESSGANKIAMWMLDTDYDEQSLLPEQVFFPMKDVKRDWTSLAKALNGAVDEALLESYTGLESLPFKAGENRKIAVKIIDDRGIESLIIKPLL